MRGTRGDHVSRARDRRLDRRLPGRCLQLLEHAPATCRAIIGPWRTRDRTSPGRAGVRPPRADVPLVRRLAERLDNGIDRDRSCSRTCATASRPSRSPTWRPAAGGHSRRGVTGRRRPCWTWPASAWRRRRRSRRRPAPGTGRSGSATPRRGGAPAARRSGSRGHVGRRPPLALLDLGPLDAPLEILGAPCSSWRWRPTGPSRWSRPGSSTSTRTASRRSLPGRPHLTPRTRTRSHGARARRPTGCACRWCRPAP